MGCRGSGSTRYSEELAVRVAGNNSAPEGYDNQYWPIHSSILAWRTPLTEKPGKPQPIGSQRGGHNLSDTVCIDAEPVEALPQ